MALTMNAQRYAVLDFEASQGIPVMQGDGVLQPPSNATASDYIDLGLPSGTMWKNSNAKGFYTYDEAVSQFGKRLPSQEQWEELMDKCEWTWTGNGYKVVGPNGNSIVLPAAGYLSFDDGQLEGEGDYGGYWSSTPMGAYDAWSLTFGSEGVGGGVTVRPNTVSVRLVQD